MVAPETYSQADMRAKAEKAKASGELRFTQVDHPVVNDMLTKLRDKNTDPPTFRRLVRKLTEAMVLEATRDLPTHGVIIETPLKKMEGDALNYPIAIIPIMRAGIGMSGAAEDYLEDAVILFAGLARDEKTKMPSSYYPIKSTERLNGGKDVTALIVDPMLATAGSAIGAAREIRNKLPECKRIRFVGLIAAPEGIKALNEAHPDVEIYVAAVDDHLNEHAYIVPGLGDAGDRQYGTG